jgi:hypothetical protein
MPSFRLCHKLVFNENAIILITTGKTLILTTVYDVRHLVYLYPRSLGFRTGSNSGYLMLIGKGPQAHMLAGGDVRDNRAELLSYYCPLVQLCV